MPGGQQPTAAGDAVTGALLQLLEGGATSGNSVFRHNNTVSDATRGDVVPCSSTLPYSATFDGVAKHTFMIEYGTLGLPDHTL